MLQVRVPAHSAPSSAGFSSPSDPWQWRRLGMLLARVGRQVAQASTSRSRLDAREAEAMAAQFAFAFRWAAAIARPAWLREQNNSSGRTA